MRNIKLIIEYDGKDFNGWQKQQNKLNIQGEIERAIEVITREKVELIASGRTDAGVHSLGQTANFKIESEMPIEKMKVAINSQLKKSIRIKNVEDVLHVGDKVTVKVTDIDDQGRINLTAKGLN